MCVNEEDRAMIKRLYGLTDKQVFEAEVLHNRTTFSLCKAAKIIKERNNK